MIIVNQDKDMIVNFDNVENIDIVADLDGTGEIPFKIYFTTSSSREELGKYKTEERAKEVLQEIVQKYKGTEALKISINRVSGNVGAIGIENAFVYEMPKE